MIAILPKGAELENISSLVSFFVVEERI